MINLLMRISFRQRALYKTYQPLEIYPQLINHSICRKRDQDVQHKRQEKNNSYSEVYLFTIRFSWYLNTFNFQELKYSDHKYV